MQSAATTRCDTDLAPYVGASLEVMAREPPPTDQRTYPPSSLSDLGAVWPHNVVWLGGWCTRCSGGNEQFSRGGSGDGVSAAALGERVASRAASGAVCGGGGRKFRPESDDGRLSWFGFGVVPSGGVAEHPGLWLRERGIFEPQAGAGDI